MFLFSKYVVVTIGASICANTVFVGNAMITISIFFLASTITTIAAVNVAIVYTLALESLN